MDLHQIQLHDIDSEGNDILLSPKNRAKDVNVTDMEESYNFGDSYLKNDITLSENLSIVNKIINSSIHVTDGNEDGEGFVKVATFIPRSSFSKIGYIYIDVIANNAKSFLELCFEKDTVNSVNLSYFRYDESPINAKLVYDNRIRTYSLYIEKTVEYSSIYVMSLKSTVPNDMLNIRWENSMYEGAGIVGATAEITPHSAYIKEGKTAPTTTDCFWNDTSTTPSVMKYWDGEKWSSFSVGSGGTTTSITLDDVMSDTSTNAVQNNIIKKYIDSLKTDIDKNISIENDKLKEYIDKTSATINDDTISKETVWSSKKIHDLGWTGTMEEYEKDKDNIPDGATVNITDDFDDSGSGADIDDNNTSKVKTWSSDKISKMIWSGTLAEYELKKDNIPDGATVNITDDYDSSGSGADINDDITSDETTWSSKKIKGLTWTGTTEEYERDKNSIPEGATVNITDDEDDVIDDENESYDTTWSSKKIKGLMWSGTNEEYESKKDEIPEGALVNITDDYDESGSGGVDIDDSVKSETSTWSSKKISEMSWSGTTEEYEKNKDNIPDGATVNITDDYDSSGLGADINDNVTSDETTWSSKKIKGLSWSGTKEEYELNKDNIPEGATVNITDDEDDVIDDENESYDTTWSSKKISEMTWTGTTEEYEKNKDNIPDGATVNITDDVSDGVKLLKLNNLSSFVKEDNSSFYTVDNKIGQVFIRTSLKAIDSGVELFSLGNISLYSEISEYTFTKDKKFIQLTIDKTGSVKINPIEKIDEDDYISENYVFLFETKL